MQEVDFKTLSFMCKLARILRPKTPMTVSEWADRNMVLPRGSSEAGRYSSKTVPYQKKIMDSITDPDTVEVIVMSSAQVGKTLIIMCGIAYYIDYEPSTQMLVMPTIDDAERFSKTRFAQMIQDIPQLAEKVAGAKSRNSNNTIRLKMYPGGAIALSGANAPSSLASDPRRIIWMDEVDRFPESAGTEGNPILLAQKRATSYWNKKFIKTSTPTVAGRSKIEDAYNAGTMDVWSVKCPECGAWQPYEFDRVDIEHPETPAMVCKECGCLIKERKWKDSEHKWIPQHPQRKKIKSFKLNEMSSPFVDWEDIINRYLKAKEKLDKFHDPEDMKVFVNTSLGETWDESKYLDDSVSEDTLQSRAESYEADIPDGVLLLTASVDVQDDRFEIEIRGWARALETWGIFKTELYGDLYKEEIWDELESYIARPLHFKDGKELNVSAFAIDTGGHHTNATYKWIKKMKEKGKKCYGVKGYNGKPDLPLLYRRTVVQIKEEKNGKQEDKVIGRTVIQIIGTDSGKDDISNHLKIQEPGPGYCHFPEDTRRGYGEEYYKGLVSSEYRVEKKVNGYYRATWVQKKGTRNEPLDLFNYNYAVEEILRPDWDKLQAQLEKGINYTKKRVQKKKVTRHVSKGIEV